MAGLRVHVVMPQELVERLDAAVAALPEPMSRGDFIRRAVERALDGGARLLPPVDMVAAVEQALGEEVMAPAATAGSSPHLAPAEQPEIGPDLIEPAKRWADSLGAREVKPRLREDRYGGNSAPSSSVAKRDVKPIPKAKS